MINVISVYKKYIRKLNDIHMYITNTYRRNNGLQKVIDSYSGESADLLEYFKNLLGSQIQYNSVIINLYGCYENFVTKICRAYLEILLNLSDDVDFPDTIKNKYRLGVSDYLNNSSKFANLELSIRDVIENYYSFLENDYSKVDFDFLLQHSGNLNSVNLNKFLRDLSLLGDANLYNSEFLEKYYLESGIQDKTEFDIKMSRYKNDLLNPLDELVNSRNSIAHTGEDENRISADKLLEQTIPFLKILARIILEVIINGCSKLVEFKNFGIIDVYNNEILCINNNGVNIKIGDIIVYESQEGKLHNAIIKEMQIDKQPVIESGNDNVNVGLKLDNRIKKNHRIICVIDSYKNLVGK